jgi:small subunit ribosomal protein S8
MNNYLTDMLARIKNGQLARLKKIKIKKSKLCLSVLDILIKEGYILGYQYLYDNSDNINILLKYNKGLPVINKIVQISKPSKRVSITLKTIWKLNNNLNTLILSTSQGILSDSQAKKTGIGGEILCKIN